MNEYPPGLYHPNLDQLVILQSSANLDFDPNSWFVAMKLLQVCIDQNCKNFFIFSNQILELDIQLAILNTVKSKNKVLLKENTNANRIITNLQSQIKILSTFPQPGKRYLSEKLPDLKLFNSDKQKLQSQTYSLKVKLARNTDCYPLESNKIQYSVGYLIRKALNQIELIVKKDNIIDFVIANNLITYLEVAFGDPDKKGTFQRKLQKLKQTNRAFSDYLTDFQQITDHMGYDKKTKCASLLVTLPMEIQQVLVVFNLPDFLKTVIAKIQKINNKLRVLKSRIPQNLVSNTNNFQVLPWPKLIYSTSLLLYVFSYLSGITPTTSPALPRGDLMNKRIKQIYDTCETPLINK